jgi:hypothetical protein
VTCSLKAKPEIRAGNNRKGIAGSIFYVVRAMPIARQRVAKHIPVEANARNNRTSIARQRPQYTGNNRITSVAVQRAVNRTVEKAVFSMWFAYTHCWTTDVFSMDPAGLPGFDSR